MASRFKEFEGKSVRVFWKNGTQSIMGVEYVSGAFVKFVIEKYCVSNHKIDDMELLETAINNGDIATFGDDPTIYTLNKFPLPRADKLTEEEIKDIESRNSEPIIFNKIPEVYNINYNAPTENPAILDKRRKPRQRTKPKAYQRHSEGGIWYVHHGRGVGVNPKGCGDTLEEAYIDWLQKHTANQVKAKVNQRARSGRL